MNDHRLHQLDEYMDGTLGPADIAGIKNHLRLCDACRTEFERMTELRERTRALPRSLRPTRDLWPGIAKRLASRKQGEPNIAGYPVLPRTGMGRWLRPVAAVAAVIAFVSVGVWWLFLDPPSGWNVAVSDGTAFLGSKPVSGEDRLGVGETLRTTGQSKALIEVGIIGHVTVEPNTRVRLVGATLTDHRLALDEGTISARIFAPPRLFFVETPSALAVDLGCAYTLSVDATGAGVLHVTSGWVALEHDGRSSVVPAGAVCKTREGFGPGTPYQEDASQRLIGELERYDFDNGGTSALRTVLGEARNMDSITLWHLLLRTSGAERALTYDRLASLVRPPDGVTREGMLAGDAEMIGKWRKYLNLGMDTWWKVL
jgi:anti-sigma factor RsiW